MIFVYKGIKGEPYHDIAIYDGDEFVGAGRHKTTEHHDDITLYKFMGPKGKGPAYIPIRFIIDGTWTTGKATFERVEDD